MGYVRTKEKESMSQLRHIVLYDTRHATFYDEYAPHKKGINSTLHQMFEYA